MAHPKRRTSKARKRKRRAHLSLTVPQPHHCPRSGVLTLSHRISEDATHYAFAKGGSQGRVVFERDDEIDV